tara:strand:+ start:197 stop:541 length:345 start_codon:yes stop_codon:yes gene_type:complete
MKLPKDINDKLNKLESSYDKKNVVLKKLSSEVSTIKNNIDYIKGSLSVKPNLLMNQGRDKKYIYGQVYYNINPQSDKKKSYRFLIGKMSDKKSKNELKQICIQHFIDKVIKEHI